MDGKLSESISRDKKWTVRRLRRRARSSRIVKHQMTEKEKLDKEEKDKDTSSKSKDADSDGDDSSDNSGKVNVMSDSSLLAECGLLPSTSNTSKSNEAAVTETPKTPVKNENVVNAEKMLFGFSLGKHHVSNIELDSDQESTDGEEELTQKGEIPDRLTPDWLLW